MLSNSLTILDITTNNIRLRIIMIEIWSSMIGLIKIFRRLQKLITNIYILNGLEVKLILLDSLVPVLLWHSGFFFIYWIATIVTVCSVVVVLWWYELALMYLLLLDVVYVESIVLAIIGIIVVVVTVPVITCIPISIVIPVINLPWPILRIS